ncbi:MAG: YqaE/Pmp3 family membrane protein [Bacteroidales bacterium]|nr:YqaE/Pmp3 family membrane protein [Bacteroidales bacterium]MBR4116230.1 YqaE/Pmp3 family membrane protein [Bacteroidales bacterium]MBR6265059.1 YqaE/Pmp3 family membrane protein [Bacteroidales bacterium]
MNDSERAELINNLPDNPAVANATEADQVVLVLLSIFIPPLAVFLNNGLGTEFWIDLILTILGWLPGMIYALLLVLGVI